MEGRCLTSYWQRGFGSDFREDLALWGDKIDQAEIWAAHDPVSLAPALRDRPLYVWFGDGTEAPGGPVIDGLEEWVAAQNRTFIARLEDLGIPITVEAGSGTHSWPFWETALHRSLPMLLETIEE